MTALELSTYQQTLLNNIDGEPIPESLQAIIGVMKPFTKEELDADDRLSYIMSE